MLFAAFRVLARVRLGGGCGRLACWQVTLMLTLLIGLLVVDICWLFSPSTSIAVVVVLVVVVVVIVLALVGDGIVVEKSTVLVDVLEHRAHKH